MVIFAIAFYSDIYSDCTPPNLAFMEKYPTLIAFGMQLFLHKIPLVKMLFHRCMIVHLIMQLVQITLVSLRIDNSRATRRTSS